MRLIRASTLLYADRHTSAMPISDSLTRKLEQLLGREAAEELVRHISESESVRGDLAELRHEMQLGFAKVDTRFAELGKAIEARSADLIKWSFVFWVGAVGAIAVLAGVRR